PRTTRSFAYTTLFRSDASDLCRDAFCGFRKRQRTLDHVADQLTAPISADALGAHRLEPALGKSPEFRLRTLGCLRGVAQLIEIQDRKSTRLNSSHQII